MKKQSMALAVKWISDSLVLLLFLFFTKPLLACEIVDDAGDKIKLAHPAQRLISLAPDLTEILFTIGAGPKIVGIVSGSDYPLDAQTIPIVATYNSIDTETILTLHPDLIVVWAETRYLAQLKKLGIPIYLSHQHTLTDVASTMKKLGCLAGTEKTANPSAEKYLKRYQALQARYAGQKKLTVFYQVWPRPLMTITKNSWINEVISLCGGMNVFEKLHGTAPEINVEAVIAANPDIIVGTYSAKEGLHQWQAWPELKAIKHKNIDFIHADLIERAGPRILDGAEEMCRIISIARKRVI
jgi:iron complex transport system substrate-binding protein